MRYTSYIIVYWLYYKNSISEFFSWDLEVAHSVKYLPCKLENLGRPSEPYEEPYCVTHTCYQLSMHTSTEGVSETVSSFSMLAV